MFALAKCDFADENIFLNFAELKYGEVNCSRNSRLLKLVWNFCCGQKYFRKHFSAKNL